MCMHAREGECILIINSLLSKANLKKTDYANIIKRWMSKHKTYTIFKHSFC
jgi:hypothetical protein